MAVRICLGMPLKKINMKPELVEHFLALTKEFSKTANQFYEAVLNEADDYMDLYLEHNEIAELAEESKDKLLLDKTPFSLQLIFEADDIVTNIECSNNNTPWDGKSSLDKLSEKLEQILAEIKK